MSRIYINDHTSYDDTNLEVSARSTNDFNVWLNFATSAYSGSDQPSFYKVQSFELTMEQANLIIDQLSKVIGEYEEAKALAEYDAQRDSIFEEESV
jgi:hypothetical protein